MGSMADSFFVYGTLKRSHLRGNLWPRKPREIVPALIQANLYDMGPYPAAALGDHWILGELWRFTPEDMPATVIALDRIEGYETLGQGNEYVRRMVEVLFEENGQEGKQIAFAYFMADPKLIATARIILPTRPFLSRIAAAWPDALARVPSSFAEE
jgi:gamma-glutamylcyclotransferase (GGCT)/AIG2-like uncharacterized protein YtfP